MAEAWRRPFLKRSRRHVSVTVLACGSIDRGDDGAAIEACRRLRSRLPADAAVRVVGQLDVDDLLAIPDGSAVVVVDAARGVRPGAIRSIPLGGLLATPGSIRPRSSHALAMPEVIGLADMIRGHPLHGRIVVIGGREFGLGAPFSERVARRLDHFCAAIHGAIAELSSGGPDAALERPG
jgi:hydrogenase maturation protease